MMAGEVLSPTVQNGNPTAVNGGVLLFAPRSERKFCTTFVVAPAQLIPQLARGMRVDLR